MIKKGLIVCVCSILAIFLVSCAVAVTPGLHPRYVHARSDLIYAQHLAKFTESADAQFHLDKAHAHIGRAIQWTNTAIIVDNKNVAPLPPDTFLDRRGRFGKIIQILQSARNDLNMEEDNPAAIQGRQAAIKNINEAIQEIRIAAHTLRLEGY